MEKPFIEVIRFASEDVIATSGNVTFSYNNGASTHVCDNGYEHAYVYGSISSKLAIQKFDASGTAGDTAAYGASNFIVNDERLTSRTKEDGIDKWFYLDINSDNNPYRYCGGSN